MRTPPLILAVDDIGSVTNLAARLCEAAKAGQIRASQRALSTVEPLVAAQSVGELSLKGFHRPMETFEIVDVLQVDRDRRED